MRCWNWEFQDGQSSQNTGYKVLLCLVYVLISGMKNKYLLDINMPPEKLGLGTKK